jgi:hypothetical protein
MVKAEFKEVQFTVDGHEVAVGHLVVEQPKPMSTDPNEVRYWGFLEDLAKLEGGKEVAF